jgi:cold shock CspA family protein
VTRHGTVARLNLPGRFGFIERIGEADVFFHANDLLELSFDEQLMCRRVIFESYGAPRGPKAANVRPAD